MAVSTSVNFTFTRDDTIEESLMALQVIGEGDAPTAAQLADHARTLNAMIKSWMAKGIHVHLIQRVTMWLTANQYEYVVGTDKMAVQPVKTFLTADSAATDTTLTVDSIANISSTNIIGVLLDDGSVFWTTVNGAPSGSTITLTTGVTTAASSGKPVWVYATTAAAGDIKAIYMAWRRTWNNAANTFEDTPIEIVPHKEYFGLSSKTDTGEVTQIAFLPKIDRNGTIFTYSAPADGRTTLHLLTKRSIYDFDGATDDADYPQEWFEAIWMGLAARLANHYGKSISERKFLWDQANMALEQVLALPDVDTPSSVQITPDNGR